MNIQQACDAFRILLEEQQSRIANANGEKKSISLHDLGKKASNILELSNHYK